MRTHHCFILTVVLLLMAPAFVKGAENEAEARCRENMEAIARAVLQYGATHEGKLPASLRVLYEEGLVPDVKTFCCPLSGKVVEGADKIDAGADYEIIKEIPKERLAPVVTEKFGNHGGQAFVYLSNRKFSQRPASGGAVAKKKEGEQPDNEDKKRMTGAGVQKEKTEVAPPVSNSRGIGFYNEGRWAEAEAAFRADVAAEPQNFIHHFYLGMVLTRVNRPVEARPHYLNSLRLKNDHAMTHTLLGHGYFVEANVAEAEKCYLEALRLEPTNAQFHVHLGNVQRYKSDWAGAEKSFRQAIAYEPKNAEHRILLGHVMAFQSRWAEAEGPYRDALQLNPNAAQALGGMGHVRMSQSNWAEAEKEYRKAATLDPNNGQYSADLAGALLRLGRVEEARGFAGQAIRLGFKTHWSYRELGLQAF